MKTVACVLFLAAVSAAAPVSQPVYQTAQFVGAQQVQPAQLPLRQQPHIQYIGAGQAQQISPLYQAGPPRTPPPPPPPPQYPPVQKAASHIAGPEYAQQVQALQLQGLANQAQAVAERRAKVAAFRIAQANRQAVAQPQYLQEIGQQQVQQAAPAAVPQSGGLAQNAQPEEDYDPNPSYQFGFDVKDDYYTNYQNRKEQRDGDKISGSYSVVDSDGFVRTVTYTADPKEGFKAEVNRQPTDIVVKIPKPVLPPLQQQQYIEEAPAVDRSQLQGQKQKYVLQYQ